MDGCEYLTPEEQALQGMVGEDYGSKLVTGFTDRRPPLEQTVHYEGEYQPDTAVIAPPEKTQYVKKRINLEDL